VPFVADGWALRRTSILSLVTRDGILDVWAEPAGAPPYPDLRRHAVRMRVGGVAVLVAAIDDLIAIKRRADRPKDLAAIEDLEAIRRLGG